jgi:hypothetical protein
MRHVHLALCAALAIAAPAPVLAENFATVSEREQFVRIVAGRALTRLGISVDVTATGQIGGRAFGYPVSGVWQWSDGYFCRDLYWGSDHLGPNCQVVRVRGDTIRFIADRGQGQSADLTLN